MLLLSSKPQMLQNSTEHADFKCRITILLSPKLSTGPGSFPVARERLGVEELCSEFKPVWVSYSSAFSFKSLLQVSPSHVAVLLQTRSALKLRLLMLSLTHLFTYCLHFLPLVLPSCFHLPNQQYIDPTHECALIHLGGCYGWSSTHRPPSPQFSFHRNYFFILKWLQTNCGHHVLRMYSRLCTLYVNSDNDALQTQFY